MNPINLKAVKISGYEGTPHTGELWLPGFGHRNIFVGQNNSGKSIVIRFLQHVQKATTNPTFPFCNAATTFNSSMFWQHEEDSGIRAVLTFSSPGAEAEQPLDSNGRLFVEDGLWHVQVNAWHSATSNQYLLAVCPMVRIDGVLLPVVLWFNGPDRNGDKYLAAGGAYVPPDTQSRAFEQAASKLLGPAFHAWLQSCRFFDTVRALDRPKSQVPFATEDGSGLLPELLAMQNDATRVGKFEKLRSRILKRLNNLFRPGFSTFELKPGPPPQMWMKKNTESSTSTPLSAMGSGLSQMLIAYAALLKDEGEPRHYFIEEPESNLHPRLLRAFVRELASHDRMRFFITTHSNIILDSVGEQDKVYYFSQDERGACSAVEAAGIVAHHSILDALGVHGGSLLQTNCVIWVEGPSDRLYVRAWLKELADARGIPIQEGVDYNFAFYGGKVLAHFDFEPDESETNEFVSLLRISRFSAVLMDRDSKPSRAKERIIASAAEDTAHRVACLTIGREIENDLPIDILALSAAKILGVDPGRLDRLTLSGKERYPIEIATHLGLVGNDAESAVGKLSRKVALAQAVLETRTSNSQSLSPPSYCLEILGSVINSRQL